MPHPSLAAVDLTAHQRDGLLIDACGVPGLDGREVGLSRLVSCARAPAMRAAATAFVGNHNFQSFSANPRYTPASAVRNLIRCDLKRSSSLITFIIEADGFLYKMCRGIVGTIVQVGLGKFSPGEIKQMLARKDRRMAGMTAPAKGLVLWKVSYNRANRASKP